MLNPENEGCFFIDELWKMWIMWIESWIKKGGLHISKFDAEKKALRAFFGENLYTTSGDKAVDNRRRTKSGKS